MGCGIKQTLNIWAMGLVQGFWGMVFKENVGCGGRDVYALAFSLAEVR